MACIIVSASAQANQGFKFEDAGSFYGGLADVKINGKYGFIDKRGKLIAPAIYESVGIFLDRDLTEAQKNGKYGFINKKGKEVIPFIYDYIPHGFWQNAEVALVKKDGKYGLIDKTGKQVIPFIYDTGSRPFEGMIRVGQGGNEFGYGGKYGYIDAMTGKEVIPLIYDFSIQFNEGLAVVQKDKKYGAVDKAGHVIVPIIYDSMDQFREGLAWVRSRIGVGYVDKNGREVVPAVYDKVEHKDGVIWVRKDDKYGLYDNTGKLLKSLASTGYKYTSRLSDDMYVVSEAEVGQSFVLDKLGIIDRNGRLILPMKYHVIYDIEEGMFMVADTDNAKLGLIDKTGRWIVPPIYGNFGKFHNGYAFVELNGLCGVIDKSGRQAVPLRYGAIAGDRLGMYAILHWSDEGLISVSDEYKRKWGFVNKSGLEVVPPTYERVKEFSEGFAAVKLGDKWGYIWPNGSVVNWSLEH